MGQSSEGGKQAHRTRKLKEGNEYYVKLRKAQSAGGKASSTHYFSDPEVARAAALKRWHKPLDTN